MLTVAAALCGPAAAAALQTVQIGAIEIAYDPDHFAIVREQQPPTDTTDAEAGPDGWVVFACIAESCPDDRDRQAEIGVTTGPLPLDDTAGDMLAGTGRIREREADWSGQSFGGLTVTATLIHSPCRNYVPSALEVTGSHDGRFYRFATGLVGGCFGLPSVPDPLFLELLSGIRVAEN
jgi:hypothetical protein